MSAIPIHRQALPYLRWGWLFLLRKDVDHNGLWLRSLRKRNRESTASVVAPGGPVVSMTTHGERLKSAYLALESIGAGRVLPSRLILWLDDESTLQNLPDSIHRLRRRGLEVRSVGANYGPHGKYYPYLKTEQEIRVPLVTADDDVVYCSWWLQGLIEAYERDSSVINCYRAHLFSFIDGRPAPYRTWKRCKSTVPSFENFGTGVSGCIYPIPFQMHLKALGPVFLDLCPKADDIWLHVNALRFGYKVKQIADVSFDFPVLPDTQEGSLARMNVGRDQNDPVIARNYSEADFKLMRASDEFP